ncbi:MAG TPA: beta-propeller fold lactonase family protein [Edaphobacter sp.]|nr:beta-propeller fold lactonase family protein [Edaphobacter sp.]
MKLSRIGRVSMALVVSVAMGLGMTACGGGTVGFMWVLGTQYNQIAGFKIDDYTGNLTNMPHEPFTSGGANPVSLVVSPGGRYLYVVNEGVTPTSGNTSGDQHCGTNGSGIAEFSVGGDGVLTFQQCFASQGSLPVWAQMDSTGSFLYVLDQRAPGTDCDATTPVNCVGDITVFSVASDTGRLTLVPNKQIKNTDGTQLTYFPVGNTPIMMKTAGAGCLFTVDSGDQTVFPYAIGAGGQLTLPSNTTIATGAGRLTSINAGSSSSVYLTDAAGDANSPGGYILPYTVGTGCALNTVTGGKVANLPQTSNPVYSMFATGSSSDYLYVANQSTTNSNAPAFSSISAYSIDRTTGKLQMIANTQGNNPYPVGSGPVCMVEDPSNQYIYTSNNVDGTVTGFSLDKSTGQLSNLKRGSKFTATGLATCLAISGSVN